MPLKAGADHAAEASDSITNLQTAGVDEGGIVKRAGDHLIVLRRGGLFAVHVAGEQLQPVSQLDAYAPGSDPRGAWYDELLIAGNTVVVGPVGRVFYVSAGSVYVWTNGTRRAALVEREPTAVPLSAGFRLPLDGSAPSGLKTAGVPTDQMSFLEDSEGHLNVLLREQGAGKGMFGAHTSRGRTALLRVPLSAFGDGRSAAACKHYRRLPGPEQAALQNRFVGDWLLWGAGESAWALRYAANLAAVALEPGHAVQRIEPLGAQALLVGNAGGGFALQRGPTDRRLLTQRSAHRNSSRAGRLAPGRDAQPWLFLPRHGH